MSNPTTGYLVAKSLASGRPTYPNPMIPIFIPKCNMTEWFVDKRIVED
jgi:hypothetical protein